MLVCTISVLFRILVQSLTFSEVIVLGWESISYLISISWFFWILFLNFSCFEGLYCVPKVIISFADSMELFCCFQQLFFIFVCFNSWKRVVRIPILWFSLVLYNHDFSHFLFFFIIQFPMILFFFIFGLVPLGVVYLRVSFYMAPRLLRDSCFFTTPGF